MGLVKKVEKVEFEDIDWQTQRPLPNTLYVMPAYKLNELSKSYKDYQEVDEIKDLNGFPLFKIVKI